MSELSAQILATLNEQLGGFNSAMGLRYVQAEADELVAELDVADHHLQPYGLVHGGVYASLIETVCSTGAALSVYGDGKTTVGLENSTSFLRAVRAGTLRATARPLVTGRRTHVWQASIEDDQQRLVATGRVRMLVLAPGSSAAGEKLGVKPSADD